jgi:cobalamin biosynthesis Mg chelatase CobN
LFKAAALAPWLTPTTATWLAAAEVPKKLPTDDEIDRLLAVVAARLRSCVPGQDEARQDPRVLATSASS